MCSAVKYSLFRFHFNLSTELQLHTAKIFALSVIFDEATDTDSEDNAELRSSVRDLTLKRMPLHAYHGRAAGHRIQTAKSSPVEVETFNNSNAIKVVLRSQ